MIYYIILWACAVACLKATKKRNDCLTHFEKLVRDSAADTDVPAAVQY